MDNFLNSKIDNVKNGTNKKLPDEIEKNNKYAVSSFAKDLLGVADNLQRALAAAEDNGNADFTALLKGVELTQNELNHVFAKFGIEPMHAMGAVFDPNYHRVVQEVDDLQKIVSECQGIVEAQQRIIRDVDRANGT